MSRSSSHIPLRPPHPERVCWGCDKYCSANDLACGNGSERTPHPCELFGDDWFEWAISRDDEPPDALSKHRADPARESLVDRQLTKDEHENDADSVVSTCAPETV